MWIHLESKASDSKLGKRIGFCCVTALMLITVFIVWEVSKVIVSVLQEEFVFTAAECMTSAAQQPEYEKLLWLSNSPPQGALATVSGSYLGL